MVIHRLTIDWQQEVHYFWAAVMFYTRIPVPNSYQHSDENFNRSRKYLPLIGIIVGSFAVFNLLVCQLFLPLSLSIALSMISTILLTGAFHEDGFADSCDGFGGGYHKEQILRIMKDSRVGTYAVVGMIAILGIKFLVLYEIAKYSIPLLCLALINGHTISRLTASLAIEKLDYVQDIDASKIKPITTVPLNANELLYSSLLALPTFIFLLIIQPTAIWSIIPVMVAFFGLCRYFQKQIEGYTGDCLGAMQQFSEVIFYLSLVALIVPL